MANRRQHEEAVPSELYQKIASELGKLLVEKDKAYGRAWLKSSEFLKLIFPNGINPDQYVDMLLIVRIFDKMSRIASSKNAFGENPFKDIAGYGILGASRSEKK